MPKLQVKGLSASDTGSDAGRLFVRLNFRRSNANSKKSLRIPVLSPDAPDHISCQRAGWAGKLKWHVRRPDPAIHVLAWIAIIGITVGLMSVFIGARQTHAIHVGGKNGAVRGH